MDVDIDFKTDFDPLEHFSQAVRASQVNNEKLTKHPAGAYFQSIPVDKISGLSAIPYKQAEDLGYFKIDFLHLGAVDDFAKYLDSKAELRQLAHIEPDWNLLLSAAVVSKLFQIHTRAELLFKLKPQSVDELADCIALIRPAKRMLVDPYIKMSRAERKAFRNVLYAKPEDGSYYYKRPHSISYAVTIVIQLHLIKAELL